MPAAPIAPTAIPVIAAAAPRAIQTAKAIAVTTVAAIAATVTIAAGTRTARTAIMATSVIAAVTAIPLHRRCRATHQILESLTVPRPTETASHARPRKTTVARQAAIRVIRPHPIANRPLLRVMRMGTHALRVIRAIA